MKTVLVRFKVYNFRSIEESEWIEVSDNTCLIGTNESGENKSSYSFMETSSG